MGKITFARKLTFGIIALTTIAVLLTTVLVMGGLFIHTERHIKNDLINDANSIITNHLTIKENEIRQKEIEDGQTLGSVLRNKDLSAIIIDKNNVVLAKYGVFRDMDDAKIKLASNPTGKYTDIMIENYGLADTYTVPIKADNDIFGYMQIARKNREIQILKDTFGIVTIIVFTLSWTLSLLFSISIVKRISEPMTRLSKHLEKLKPENMMPIADSPSMDHELSVVVGSLNNMILRLKDNMKRERQITENISHEFKTPLTRIASNLQVGRVKEAEVEVLELGGNVDALLSLAIWDNAKENTDLIPIIKHLKKLIPDELSVNIILAKKILTSLPSAHLQIIFRNLIDNAIKHNKANGEIKIVGRILEKKWVVEIENTTKNVVDKNRVTLRKYKTGKGAGQGIGMAIVADMCRMHGLTLDYIDEAGRAKVIVSGVIVG